MIQVRMGPVDLERIRFAYSHPEIAVQLGHSPPSVSQHLSVLRRCGLVTSWRSGRRVLYRRTPLATSIIAAAATGTDGSSELA